jgi:hypothetical protein
MKHRTNTRNPNHNTSQTCEELEKKLHEHNSRLYKFEEKLDDFLSNSESSLEEISNVTGYITILKKEIEQIEANQKKLGCFEEEKPTIAFDDETILSTSSVRRKTRADLAKTVIATETGIE